MAIDSSIYGQIKPVETPNLLAQYAQISGIQNAQNQNALAQYSLSKAKRDDENQSNLLRQLASAGGDWDAVQRAYIGAGMADKAATIAKDRLTTVKTQGEIDAKDFETATKRYNFMRQTLGALAQEPALNKEMVVQAGTELVKQGILPMSMYQQSIANMPDDPMQLRTRLMQGIKAQMTPEQIFTVFAPKPEKVDNGRTITFVDNNPNSPTYGKQTGAAPVQKQITPGETATLAQGERHFQAGQNAPQYMETEQGVVALPKKPGAGPIVAQQVMGADGKPLPGKPNAAKAKELMSIDQQNAIIDGAINAVKGTPSAFTFSRGVATMAGSIPESIAGRLDSDEQRQARAYVFNNVSRVINERAGAAQSKQELARLRSFLPAETDGPAQIESKLNGFKQYLADLKSGTNGGGPTARVESVVKAKPATQVPAGSVKFLGFE